MRSPERPTTAAVSASVTPPAWAAYSSPQGFTGMSRVRASLLVPAVPVSSVVIWREAGDLDPELIFNVDYLGGTMPTLAINFSRPASQVVATNALAISRR